jgi:PAS domain S-box-containing protein
MPADEGSSPGGWAAVSSALIGYYDPNLVALSVSISTLAAYGSLNLAGRLTMTAQAGARQVWVWASAAVLGIGAWTAYSIGMAAFHLPIPVIYGWPTVLLSLFTVILAAGAAILIVSRPERRGHDAAAGGVLIGGGIAATHYLGMEALRIRASVVYSPGLVLLSVLLAIVLAWAAMQLAFPVGNAQAGRGRRLGSVLFLGLAAPITHYTGMTAVQFIPRTSVTDHDSVSAMSVSIAGIAVMSLLILGLIFVSFRVNRRLSVQQRRFTQDLVQLEAVFETMQEAIVVVDCVSGQIRHNRASSELLGFPGRNTSLQEISGLFEALSPSGDLLAPEEWPIVRAIRGDYCRDCEIIIRRKDTGTRITVETTTVPIAAGGEGHRTVIVSLRDISERKRMDEARTRLVAIVESSEDAIIGKDTQGVVTSWNPGAEKIFGYSAAEMIGHPIKILLPEDRAHEEDDILNRIRRGETVDHFETVRQRKDGELIHVSLSISPIRNANGRIVGASKIARNTTETKKLEHQLHQSQKMDAIGQLTGGIAHDFNNLLGIILGNLDLLEDHVARNGTALEQVQTCQRAATRGADLTRRLLAFARMEGLKPQSTPLNAAIQNVIGLAKRALGPEIKITTRLDDSLPRVFVDATGLDTALLNLLVNARDAMPHGGSIAVSTRLNHLEDTYAPVKMGELKPGWYACASISDTGEGMSKETLERVFEPFFTTKARGKGTGLGLAMVYGFVKQSGGTIRIYSEPGKGTTVTLYLPLVEGRLEETTPAIDEQPPIDLDGTVLVVDDEADLLKIATAYLAELGCAALQAFDGASALEIVGREKSIRLMVTDIVMPGGMNGVELAQRVHELNPAIKLIYSSGFPADALAERELSLVDGPLLHKPYQRTEFKAMVRGVLAGRGPG